MTILKIPSRKVFFTYIDSDMTLETQTQIGSLIDEPFLHFCVRQALHVCNALHISDFKVFVCSEAKLISYLIYDVLL